MKQMLENHFIIPVILKDYFPNAAGDTERVKLFLEYIQPSINNTAKMVKLWKEVDKGSLVPDKSFSMDKDALWQLCELSKTNVFFKPSTAVHYAAVAVEDSSYRYLKDADDDKLRVIIAAARCSLLPVRPSLLAQMKAAMAKSKDTYIKEGLGYVTRRHKLLYAPQTLTKAEMAEDGYLNALAKISCINYANAKRNPLAQTRKWFMSYEEASHRGTESNPNVGGLLGVSDCSQVTDGAAVVILCSEKYAQEKGLKDKAFVKGYGHRTAPLLFDKKIADNVNSEYVLPWTHQACMDAYKRAGLTVYDIDVFETHDCFTSSEYAAISAFGITEPGKECEAVENGVIAFDGAKPINPSGGLIGCGHPVGASGARMFIDLYKQVTGKTGRYQVEGAKNGMMLNIGGSATTNYVFIVGRKT